MNIYPQVLEFTNHCCHYSYDILKCGEASCTMCSPVCLPVDVFNILCHIPHPTPGEDGHYLEAFGFQTTEEHRTSFKKKSYV